MKPLFLKKHSQSETSSFYALKIDVPHIYDKWHYHKELELHHVVSGKGTRFIGNSVEKFEDGDLVLVGTNLPHVWKSDQEYYEDETIQATVILIQFLQDFVGDVFLNLPEMKGIKKLLEDSIHGIKVDRNTMKQVSPILDKIIAAESTERVLLLIKALELMAESDYQLLSSNWFSKSYSDPKNMRVNKVCDHIMVNFHKKITLEELAEVANMNNAALCRYFKTTTKKTITDFINEVRIGYAFNLLSTEDVSVTQACYASGFNSLSYFNRQFSKIVGHAPSKLQKSLA